MKKELKKVVSVVASSAIITGCFVGVNTYANAKEGVGVKASNVDLSSELNNYLSSLSYSSTSLLTTNGETISNVFQKGSENKPGEFVVIEKIKKNISSTTSDISVTSANEERVFPGALVKVDQNFLENKPTLISEKRAPLTLSVDLPGMTNNSNQITVENPTASSVKGAVNTLLDRWNTTYSASYPNTAARVQYDQVSAQSSSQLKAKFGLDFNKISVPLNIDFSAVHSGEKQVEVVNFKQIYYTVSMDAPNNPKDVFDSSVSAQSLKNKGVDSTTPPAYISSVSYGRSMYVKFETTSKSNEFSAAVQAAIKGVQINPSGSYSQVLKNTKFTAVILGGDSGEATKVVSGNIDDLKALIQSGSRYNNANPAVPVSYTAIFLKDNEVAKIQNSTDYVETKITSYKNGELILNHRGAYIAKYYINWDEVSYDAQGKEILTPKSWEYNGQPRTAGFSTTIQLKGNVRNLRVKVQERTGLVWEKWRTVYDKSDLPLVQQRTITHWGTTLNPKSSDTVKNK